MTKQEVLNIDTNTALMSINQLKESIKKLKEELGQLKIGSQQYEQKSKELITAQNNLKKANDLTKASMDNFSNSIAGMQIKLTNVRRELYQMSTTDPKFKLKAKEVEQLAAALNKAKIAAGDYKNNIGNYKSGFGAFGNIMKGGAGALLGFSTVAGAAAAGVALLAKGVSHMIDVNKTFEQENANLAAILGTTKEKITDLSDAARQLGNSTLYTAQEVTQLQTVLAKLGFNSREIKNMESSVLNFATAVGTDLPDAAELAGAVLRSFGRDSSEANAILNQLALSTTTSALSFEKLATAMPIVGPVAHQLGFELSDTVSILAKLVDTGMDASTAATSTRNIMLFLADSSSNLSKALGHSVNNVDEFAEALQELNRKGLSLGEIFDLADKRSVAALSTLIEQSGALSAYKKELIEAGDAIDRMATERMNTLEGASTLLKSAWDDLMLSFSGTNGILASITREITDFINKTRELVDGLYKTSDRNAAKYVDDQTKELATAWTDNYNQMIEAAGGNVADIVSNDADAIQRLQEAAEKVKTDSSNKLKDYQSQLDQVNSQLQEVGKNVDRVDKLNVTSKLFGLTGKAMMSITSGLTEKSKERAAALIEEKNKLSLLIAEQQRYIDGQATLNADLANQKKVDNNKNSDGKVDKSAIANLRARYEALTQYEISELKKKNKAEVDFENESYAVKEKYLNKTLKLYAKNSTEYYHMIVKIEQERQAHLDRLNKIDDAKFKAMQEEEILEYTKLNAAMILSDKELADEILRIQKKYLAERKGLYDKNSKEYQEILKEEAKLERKREKEREDENRKLVKQGEEAFKTIQKELRELTKFNLSDISGEDERYFEQLGKLNEAYNLQRGALLLKRAEAEKTINESEILLEADKLKLKQELNEQYFNDLQQLNEENENAIDLADQKHAELRTRFREQEIIRGAQAAIDVLDLFNQSLQDDILSAVGDGISNMFSDIFSTFENLGPIMDNLDKSLADIGISMTTQQKSLVKIGALSATTFNAMSSMLSGIADAQDATSREGFETAKKLNIASATMSMIGGVVNSIAGIPSYIEMFKALGIGAPAAGIALGSSLATMVGILGAVNIAKIASQKFDGSSSGAATNTGALNSIVAPVSYSANVEGASTTDNVDQERYVVHVEEINQVQNRVRVAENEARF